MRLPIFFRTSTLFAACLIAACTMQAQLSSYTIVSAPFTVDTTTAIPGTNLKPGAYTIRVIDSLKDRYILGVDDGHNKELATFIGLKEAQFPGNDAKGPIEWQNAPGRTSALRGFSFSNGLSLEFVYPKATAVELAKLNSSSVPAIDPESEGMPVDPKLSVEDRKVVSLWMLTSTRVGPGKGTPAIEVKRFQAEADTEQAKAAPPQSPIVQRAASTDVVGANSGGVATRKTGAVAAMLPQTASDLPLVLMSSIVLLFAGFGVRAGRRLSSQV